jgi:hypothetical protein
LISEISRKIKPKVAPCIYLNCPRAGKGGKNVWIFPHTNLNEKKIVFLKKQNILEIMISLMLKIRGLIKPNFGNSSASKILKFSKYFKNMRIPSKF